MRKITNILKRIRIRTFCCALLFIFLLVNLYLDINKNETLPECYLIEPIDVVYTWVNGSDPKFLLNLSQKSAFKKNLDISKQRFDDKNELRFSLRSLEKYAPWINHVYVVTNGQIPFWLNLDYEKITIIPHEQIFKDNNNLPTFSSSAIESNLHRIPGLSKKFIYLNDDIFLGLPIYPDDFYAFSKGYSVYLAWAIPGCTSDCPWLHVGDGQCDSACNIQKCQFDGGDCSKTENFINKSFRYYPKNTTEALDLISKLRGKSSSYTLHNNSSFKSGNYIIRNNTWRRDNRTDIDYIQNNKHFLMHYSTNANGSISQLVEQYNRNVLKVNKKQNRRRHNLKQKRTYLKHHYVQFDGYFESLQYTQKLLNKKYGFKVRRVPAHAPIMIERDIMQKLQDTFPTEYEITERNIFRQADDIQFGFSYYYFLMSETEKFTISNIFDEFDSDHSGTWSDREIRNLLAKIYELPLSYEVVDYFESILLNCTDQGYNPNAITPPYERYIDSKLPTITRDLVIHCPFLKGYLEEKHSDAPLYKFNIIHNLEDYVSFKMLVSNITHVVMQLDEIRRRMTYGADAVTSLLPKVINTLELLENLATKNERENIFLNELQLKVSQLENDKLEKAEYRQKFEKELEIIEDQWRSETKELVMMVSKLQEENQRLLKDHSPDKYLSSSLSEPVIDGEMIQRLKNNLEKQRDEIREKERQFQDKCSEAENLKSQIERLTTTSRELRRKNKSVQNQVRTLCNERADFLVQLQDQQRDINGLRQRLGLAQKENEDLVMCDIPLPPNKAVYDLDDPNRPRFTTQELKDILHERNELKARVSDLEDELETYRPKKKVDTCIYRLSGFSDKVPELNYSSSHKSLPLVGSNTVGVLHGYPLHLFKTIENHTGQL
ncbi:N-acetylglucosamine-1-phosphotransferase subunits alpha/beta-like isoform X3 [Rhynchophorus ferrugineus]|uniref:N-acetylglucosamine-1-phosphotransferase subunits alpha/beta-like isoform X3 n=1 Tax=Rhynchophorus ferrugineus TaxID=354439 RepID=UPI003FCE5CB6